jgi:hypothetical protein
MQKLLKIIVAVIIVGATANHMVGLPEQSVNAQNIIFIGTITMALPY